MLIPAFTIRPVPAQRRLPIIAWSSSTTPSIRPPPAAVFVLV
jgi:hypothetical protein